MSNIAIRVENYILSGVEGLSKLYPAVAPRARHLGRAQSRAGDSLRSQRHDTLRDALVAALPRIPRISRNRKDNSSNSTEGSWQGDGGNSSNSTEGSWQKPEDLWALKEVSFEACPESDRRVKQGEVVGIIGRNGAGTLAPRQSRAATAASAGESTLLKILSRITEPTSGRAETFGGRVASLLDASRGTGSQSDPELILRPGFANGLKASPFGTGPARASAARERRHPWHAQVGDRPQVRRDRGLRGVGATR